MATSSFLNRLRDKITTGTVLTLEAFERQFGITGISFSNCFASVQDQASQVNQRPYDQSIFLDASQLPYNYAPPVIIDDVFTMTEPCANFIKVLTNNEPDKVNIFRLARLRHKSNVS